MTAWEDWLRTHPYKRRSRKQAHVRIERSPSGTLKESTRGNRNLWAREGRIRREYISKGYDAGVRFDPYREIYHLVRCEEPLPIDKVAEACGASLTVFLRHEETIRRSPEFTLDDFVSNRLQVAEGVEMPGLSLIHEWGEDVGYTETEVVDRYGYYQRVYKCLAKLGVTPIHAKEGRRMVIAGYMLTSGPRNVSLRVLTRNWPQETLAQTLPQAFNTMYKKIRSVNHALDRSVRRSNSSNV